MLTVMRGLLSRWDLELLHAGIVFHRPEINSKAYSSNDFYFDFERQEPVKSRRPWRWFNN